MRGGRNNQNIPELWRQNRTTAGQRISGRTGRGRNHERIGIIGGRPVAVDIGLKLDDAANDFSRDNDIVQCLGSRNRFTFALDLN